MSEDAPPLDVEATIVVRIKPELAGVCLAGTLVLTAMMGLVAWLLVSGRAGEWGPGAYFWFVVSTFGTLFCLYAAAIWVWLLVTSQRPVLAITPAGILDRRFSEQLIPWSAVTRVNEAWSRGVIRLGAHLALDRAGSRKVRLAWPSASQHVDRLFGLNSMTVSAVATNIDARSLYAVLNAYWKAHRHSKEPLNV